MRKLQTTLTVILIILSVALWAVKPAQAMRREPGPALSVPVEESPRFVRVNIPGPNARTTILVF